MWKKLLVLAVVAGVVALPPVWELLQRAAAPLASLDVGQVKEYILSFGIWAPVVSFLLMIFQSVIAPLPAFLLTFANAALFGWWQGAILSWASAMAGAMVCFGIARWLGRDAVVKLTGNSALRSVDVFFERYGKNTILVCRLLPFVSFDLVSYAAGLTPMRKRDFLVATGLGQLPATIVYSYVGGMLTGSARLVVTGLFCLFALSVIVFGVKQAYQAKHAP